MSTTAGSLSDGSHGRAPHGLEWKGGVGQVGAQAFREQSHQRQPSGWPRQPQATVPGKASHRPRVAVTRLAERVSPTKDL